MNKFLKEFKDRGYFYQCTNEEDLSKLLDKEKIKGYIGFDCTAESLHVGSLLQIMCLRLMQKHGHRPIVLIGGGTTRIGDPSGKDKTRKILSEAEIEKNIKNIEKILKTKIYQMVLLLMMVLQYFLLTENQQRFILLEKVIMLILLIKINNLI